MTTVIQARPRQFVNTPAVERIAKRALRYLNSGFSIHLRGPAGTGKTTLALHLADLVGRPMMLIFGDNELKSSDLIGNKNGYTRKKVVDNFIHSVVKIEDELKQSWTDARLTLACKQGFTLVYDEFNRSRPEVNNVLLSALEEKLLILPPGEGQSEYIRVNPQFRAIFTSNPEEYCGVHGTQDALLDRLVTINMPDPDEQTQQAILVEKTKIDTGDALRIVQIVKRFRERVKQSIPETDSYEESAKHSSPLRSCLMIAKVSQENNLIVRETNPEFREICADVLLSRTNLARDKAQEILETLLDSKTTSVSATQTKTVPNQNGSRTTDLSAELKEAIATRTNNAQTSHLPDETENDPRREPRTEVKKGSNGNNDEKKSPANADRTLSREQVLDWEQKVYEYLQTCEAGVRVSQISQALKINRFQTINALRSLIKKGTIAQRSDLLYVTSKETQS